MDSIMDVSDGQQLARMVTQSCPRCYLHLTEILTVTAAAPIYQMTDAHLCHLADIGLNVFEL